MSTIGSIPPPSPSKSCQVKVFTSPLAEVSVRFNVVISSSSSGGSGSSSPQEVIVRMPMKANNNRVVYLSVSYTHLTLPTILLV